MPAPKHYYFNIRSPQRETRDNDGVALPSDEQAQVYARRLIDDIRKDLQVSSNLEMVIRDDEGREIAVVPFTPLN